MRKHYIILKSFLYNFTKGTLDRFKNLPKDFARNWKKSLRIAKLKYYIKSDLNEYKRDILLNKDVDCDKIAIDIMKSTNDKIAKKLKIKKFSEQLKEIIENSNDKELIKSHFKIYYSTLDSKLSKILDKTQKESKSDLYYDSLDKEYSTLPRYVYKEQKRLLQIELLKLQEWVIANNKKVAIVFEGRDAAGKGSTIKRFVEYLIPKNSRVVEFGIPNEYERTHWFERYYNAMPKEGEIVFFDRSWYNRAVVEPAMGYCSKKQYIKFMESVNEWERNLIEDKDTIIIKLWFSVSKEKQLQRFDIRQNSPLKYWKFSPNDMKAVDKWERFTFYKDQMFEKTSTSICPWVIVKSDDKPIARLNAMRYVLSQIDYVDKDSTITIPDKNQVFLI